ncbi:MAG: PilZ domain-containing protein [Spirochaetales bacterium]|nr:PilZ domain-containing protein [Spirochaetales bacterium]
MPVTTSQQLSNYLRDFAETEVTFTKEVIHATRLNPSGVHLKCLGDQWPCVVHSLSMTSGKIITNLQSSLNERLQKANNMVSLRLSFSEADKAEPVAFFVKAKTTGFTPYGKERPNLYFANLTFTQQPPDDLILVLGRMLEAKHNSKRRREWRLPLSASIVKRLGIVPGETTVTDNQSRKRAILRDVSFSGCKAIVADPSGDFLNKNVSVNLTFQDPDELFEIPASVCRSDPVEGHSGICVFGFQYEEERIPMAYKLRINNAIRAQRTDIGE